MTKKEYCKSHPILGMWSAGIDSGVAIHGIEYTADGDYVYYTGVRGEKRTYHKCKIHYYNERPYFTWGNMDIFLDEVLRVSRVC